jgi:protein gp37
MGLSAIEWTNVTDNVIVAVNEKGERHGWWCRKISPGCALCYAETLNDSAYFKGNHLKYSGQPPVLKLREDIIDSWPRQKTTRKHFVMSMSDLFGDWVPRSWIFRVLDGMHVAPRQIFQVLTKRADIMRREVMAWLGLRGLAEVPRNIWLGCTVEDQQRANERLPELVKLPALRFVSCEPLLGEVDLEIEVSWDHFGDGFAHGPAISRLDWVITGGETSKRRKIRPRPTHPEWFLKIAGVCAAYDVAHFHKQNGDWASYTHGGNVGADEILKHPRVTLNIDGRALADHDDDREASLMVLVGKKQSGRLLAGREYSQFPEVA